MPVNFMGLVFEKKTIKSWKYMGYTVEFYYISSLFLPEIENKYSMYIVSPRLAKTAAAAHLCLSVQLVRLCLTIQLLGESTPRPRARPRASPSPETETETERELGN